MTDDRPQPRSQQDRPKKRDVNGWIVLDKGVGMTSTSAVAAVNRALWAKKAGHAGTLDPLASGILPIALGGVLLVLLGAGAVVVARRRNSSQVHI